MDAPSPHSGNALAGDGRRYATNLPVEVGRLFGIANCEATRYQPERRVGAVRPWVQGGRQRASSRETRLKREMMRDRLTKRHVYWIPELSAEVGHQGRGDPDIIVERSRWPHCRFRGG